MRRGETQQGGWGGVGRREVLVTERDHAVERGVGWGREGCGGAEQDEMEQGWAGRDRAGERFVGQNGFCCSSALKGC